MDARIESRLQLLKAEHEDVLQAIGKLWKAAAKQADAKNAESTEPYFFAQPMGIDALTAREKQLERRLTILKEASKKETLTDVIYTLSIKAGRACEALAEFGFESDDMQEYWLSLAEISECNRMIAALA